MPNIATILKEEIIRVARKEIRSEIASLKKAAASHRADIADLKRRAGTAEKELRALQKALAKEAPAAEAKADSSSAKGLRFSAKGLASQRKRLALSAEECGLLVGATGQSIYNWESGSARPRAAYLPAIAELKKIGKKEAA